MPNIFRDRAAADRQELQDKKDELSALQGRNEDVSKRLKASFMPDGSITREGLELEMIRLDIERRSKNPLDQGVQALIQGQQNEITHLLQAEKILLREKENILQTFNELEAAKQTLVNRIERRSKNDAA